MRKFLFYGVVAVALLAGCRGEGPRGENRPTPMSAPAAEGGGAAEEGGGVGQTIALRLWTPQNDAAIAAYQALADVYAAANPGIAITIEAFDPATYEQTVLANLRSNTAADVLALPGGAVCANAAQLAPIPEVVTTAANAQTLFLPGPLQAFTCDGALYGLPQESATPWGLVVSASGPAQEVAWDFARFVALDPANAAQWNAATGTPPALGLGS
jgi:ABC-type glycerol-3-phosphate transport system substrate-binding protein